MAVFATRWDFLFAQVLIGVDRSTGVFSGNEPVPGQQMVCVWTSRELATDSLHVESWDLQTIAVRELLTVIPSGIGVVVDPERSTGMTASASYIAQLKPYVTAFPVGSEVRLGAWDLPETVRESVVRAATQAHPTAELRAFAYTVDDSPLLGCVAHDVAAGADATAVASSIDAALASADEASPLGVATVNVLRMDELPEQVRASLGDSHVIARRRSRPWRRRGQWSHVTAP